MKAVKTIFKWLGRLLLGLMVILVVLIAIGLVRESFLRHKYHAEFPAPGEIVTVNGHEIHIYCIGEGSPTVVFESDLDQYGSLSWDSVQGEIGKHTRTCSYDRAGILWSEPGPRPRDGEMIAAELKAILEAAGEDGPYILVGHAFGGVYLRIFAGQYPEDVAGMVLIESGHPEMLTRFEALDLVREIPEKSIRPLIWLLSHLGSPSREGGIDYDLSEGVEDPVRAFLPESSMAWYDEMVEAPATLAQAGVYDVLGDFPLIVIAASKPPVSVDRGEELDQLWLELQGELVALSTEGELRVYQTGHYPQYQSPEIVIQAVLDVLERAGT